MEPSQKSQMTFIIILRLNTCYRLDFSFDFNIIEVGELKETEINYVAMTTDLENNISFKKKFDLGLQGKSL